MTNKNPTTDRDELESMTKEELVGMAETRGLTVTRGDGEEGDPLKADYVEALATGGTQRAAAGKPTSGTESGRLDETIAGGRYLNAEGKTINAEGKRIDDEGNLVDEEAE